mmetsp:Transcript_40489/g.104979  ORF Transcript_40489/g.104979 Transcript_40489/m.104979 type:complete len:216 (+) Transcript_40489:517-1164(+)
MRWKINRKKRKETEKKKKGTTSLLLPPLPPLHKDHLEPSFLVCRSHLMGNIHVLLCANVAEEIEIGAHPWIASPVQDLWNETRPLCARKRHSVSYRDKTSGACFLFVCHQNLGLPFDGRTGGENDRVGDGSEKVASASCAPPNASVSQGNDIGSNICLAPPSVCPGVLRTIFPQATSFVPWDSPPVLESPFLVFGDAVPDPSFVWTPARPSGPVA